MLLLRPGRVLRSFLRREASPYVGAQQQLAVPPLTSACYTAFWLTTLALKFTFGHFFLITPLVEPLSVLWNYQDQCWASTEFCAPKVAGSVHMAGERQVRQMVFTLLLMGLRAVVPLLVYFFDTFIWYTVTSSCVSISMATYQRIGRVSSWSQLVRTLDLSVELFNQKMLNLDDVDTSATTTTTASATAATTMETVTARRGLPGCIARFLAAAGGPEGARRPWERDDNFAFEPRSRQWQYFGRAWNEIVISLRDGDLLSDAEVTNLCFRFLADEPTFGVPEYVIYPSMLTSPVFTLLVARGVFRTSYPSFARTLRQTRDLTVWLLVTLGAVRMGERQQLVSALSELAYTEAKLRARRRRGDPGGLLHLRTAVVELLQAVLHAHEAAVEASGRESESEGEGEGEGDSNGDGEGGEEGEGDARASFEEYSQAAGAAEAAAAGATEPLARLPALLTAVMEAVKRLFTSTEAAVSMSEDSQRVVELYRTLRCLVRIEELQGAAARRRLRASLCVPGVEMAVGAVLASLTTTNPGGAPRNEEARRQLVFHP